AILDRARLLGVGRPSLGRAALPAAELALLGFRLLLARLRFLFVRHRRLLTNIRAQSRGSSAQVSNMERTNERRSTSEGRSLSPEDVVGRSPDSVWIARALPGLRWRRRELVR